MKKILIVEEKTRSDSGIELLLSEAGFKTYVSAGNEDGIEIAINYQPDLIICNIEKIEDGLNVLKELSANASTAVIPKIFLSKLPDICIMRRAMEMGTDDFISYPLEEYSLVAAIQKIFYKRELIKEDLVIKLSTSFGDETNPKIKNDHILIKIGNKLKFVKFAKIVVICAQKEYSQVVTTDNCKIIVRKSLRNWLDILPSQSFLQIHRATIVNMEFVEKIVKTNTRSYEVYLKHIVEPFPLSQRFANIMRKTFPS